MWSSFVRSPLNKSNYGHQNLSAVSAPAASSVERRKQLRVFWSFSSTLYKYIDLEVV